MRSSSVHSPRHDPAPDWAVAIVPFAVVFAVCLLWLPRMIERLDPLTGDEPFYVVTAIGLVQDHDLEETNNYAERDYDRFYPADGPTARGWPGYPDPLPPHATHAARPGIYTKHGLGLSFLIALPWAAGGRELTLLLLAAIAALVAANTALLARDSSGSTGVAIAAALALALTNPLLSFSLLIFPEVTAALCLAYALRRLLQPTNARWQWACIGLAAGFLPWLHYRLAPISLGLAVIAVARFRRVNRAGDWVAAALPPALLGVALLGWFSYLYGRPLPPGDDHAGFSGVAGTINGLAGTALDQQWGALLHNPLLGLALCAAAPFAVARPRTALVLVVVALPYLVLTAAYRVWWGEWNPPGRYLTVLVPLAAAPLAWWLTWVRPWVAWIAGLAALLPAAAVMATFVWDPQLMYNQPDGTSRLLEQWATWSGFDLTRYLPSYVFYALSPGSDRVIAALLAGVAIAAGAIGATVACGPGRRP